MNKAINNIFIIILNYDNTVLTKQCVKSCLAMAGNNHIVLVDNNSKDKTYRGIKALHPQIILLENTHNLGYAGGNNVGIRYALENDADYILILNNDTTVAPDLLVQLVNGWDKLDNPGALGCKVFYLDNPKVINSFGTAIDIHPLHGRHLYNGENDSPHLKEIIKTDYIHGCAFFTSAAVIKDVGGFDERFFTYWEDTDLSYRIKRKGYGLYCLPEAILWHYENACEDSVAECKSPSAQYYGIRNMLLFAKKNMPGYDALKEAMDCLETLKKAKYQPLKTKLIWATGLAIKDYKNGKYGKASYKFKKPEEYIEYPLRNTLINFRTRIYNLIYKQSS